jgi:hypothetical protein
MNSADTEVVATGDGNTSRAYSFLERLTGAVLLAVVIAVAWMTTVAYWPDVARLASVQIEVILMLGLLTTALLLVSLVALVHTRSSERADATQRQLQRRDSR